MLGRFGPPGWNLTIITRLPISPNLGHTIQAYIALLHPAKVFLAMPFLLFWRPSDNRVYQMHPNYVTGGLRMFIPLDGGVTAVTHLPPHTHASRRTPDRAVVPELFAYAFAEAVSHYGQARPA